MTNNRILILIVFLIFNCNQRGFSQRNFVKITLPQSITFELPKNWTILSDNQRISIDSAVEAGLDLSEIESTISNYVFASNLYNDLDRTIGILNFRFYPDQELTQEDIEDLSEEDILFIDNTIKDNILKVFMSSNGEMELTNWIGTKLIKVNGINTILTSYRRSSLLGDGEFIVKLVRIINGSNSFTLTVSYLDSEEIMLKPITNKIINSLVVDNLKKKSSFQSNDENIRSENNSIDSSKVGDNRYIYSLIITWLIGLIPPIFLRFSILKKPLNKKWAILIATTFYFINLAVFSFLLLEVS